MNLSGLFQKVVLFGGVMLLTNCHSNDNAVKTANRSSEIFDVDAFFKREIERLTKENPVVQKSVLSKDGQETKRLKISNWKNELSAFQTADISKNFDSTQYSLTKNANKIIIKAKNKNLPLQLVQVDFCRPQQVSAVLIEKIADNTLYHNVDKMFYIPDSVYRIDKQQKIIGLGKSSFVIEGKFKPGFSGTSCFPLPKK